MKGFQDKFTDLPDYIVKITKEIWEERGLTTLRHYYAPDLPMRFPSGLVIGNQAVIDGTLATLAEFPERQLLAEDVIWSGNEDEGFLSSHRLVTMGTHLGHGVFGEPTGRRFEIRAIADCANDQIGREGGPEKAIRPFTPATDVQGGYTSRGNDNEWGQLLADILTRIMDKDLAVIRSAYDRAVRVEHPGAMGGWSWEFADFRWMQLRAAFPSARFAIHHVIGRSDPAQPHRAAVRWSLDGRHDGFGAFGAPTGAPVHVMGITHAEFGPWGLRREFTLFDEIAIWKQIHLHTGDL
jgi:hypothetical protein